MSKDRVFKNLYTAITYHVRAAEPGEQPDVYFWLTQTGAKEARRQLDPDHTERTDLSSLIKSGVQVLPKNYDGPLPPPAPCSRKEALKALEDIRTQGKQEGWGSPLVKLVLAKTEKLLWDSAFCRGWSAILGSAYELFRDEDIRKLPTTLLKFAKKHSIMGMNRWMPILPKPVTVRNVEQDGRVCVEIDRSYPQRYVLVDLLQLNRRVREAYADLHPDVKVALDGGRYTVESPEEKRKIIRDVQRKYREYLSELQKRDPSSPLVQEIEAISRNKYNTARSPSSYAKKLVSKYLKVTYGKDVEESTLVRWYLYKRV